MNYRKMKLPRGHRSHIREALQEDGVCIMRELSFGEEKYRASAPLMVRLFGDSEDSRTMACMFNFHNDWQAPTWDVEGMRKAKP